MIRLQLPDSHVVCAYIFCQQHESYAMVHLPDNKVTPWATYFVRKDGLCLQGEYLRSELEARRDLMERAGWTTVG